MEGRQAVQVSSPRREEHFVLVFQLTLMHSPAMLSRYIARLSKEVLSMDSRLLWGTVEMLILEVVSNAPTYGYEIAQTVCNRSRGYFELKEGSLYPALHRLERQNLLSSLWREIDGRRRKYYKLTLTGQKALEARKQEWMSFATGVQGVLGGALQYS